MIQSADEKLETMKVEMAQKVKEIYDLMNETGFDLEMSVYDQLLLSEERRLNPITPVVDSPRDENRKLFVSDKSESEFSNVITVSSTGDIEISEVCPNGQFVKLHNKGSEVRLKKYDV